MKHAVSPSLGSSKRDKSVVVTLGGEQILVERLGTDGDVAALKKMYREMDGKVDAFGMGGVDLYIRLDKKEYPLYAALDLVKDVHLTPICDGRGLKHTLERRLFELALPQLGTLPHFRQAFVPVAIDRVGLAEAVTEVSERVLFGDLMVALGIPVKIWGLRNYLRVAKSLMPFVSRFPLSMLFYGSGGSERNPKYLQAWQSSDLLAGDFLFLRKYVPDDLAGKVVITNTTTEENVEFMKARGVKLMITSTPRYEGRSFGTNMMEATLTAYAGKGRRLTDAELNGLIDSLELKPSVTRF